MDVSVNVTLSDNGFNLVLEGVRQIRGTSTSQVEDAEISLEDFYNVMTKKTFP